MNMNEANGSIDHLPKKINQRPKYSRFSQQELSACKPILTPAVVVSSFILVAVAFIPIGLACLFASDNVVEIQHRYDQHCLPQTYSHQGLQYIQSTITNKTCTSSLIVPREMKSPIFVYYQLDNFYQNHRRYVKSRNDEQLRSRAGEAETKNCDPEVTSSNGPIVPCGLIAWSLFNDTYRFSVRNKLLDVSKKNIAWKSDREHKYGSDVYPKNFQSGGLIGGAKLNSSIPLSEQEDLIVWMRTAALPTFRKLYGRIEESLQANDVIEVVIQNNYNTYSYNGKKTVILSTTTWIGGRNQFLGIAYLSVGSLCLFIAILFILVFVLRPRSGRSGHLLILLTCLGTNIQMGICEVISGAHQNLFCLSLRNKPTHKSLWFVERVDQAWRKTFAGGWVPGEVLIDLAT